MLVSSLWRSLDAAPVVKLSAGMVKKCTAERERRVVVIGSVLIDAYLLKDLLLLLPATVQHCIYIFLLVSIKVIPRTCVHAVFMYVCCVGHTDQENGRDAAMPTDDR